MKSVLLPNQLKVFRIYRSIFISFPMSYFTKWSFSLRISSVNVTKSSLCFSNTNMLLVLIFMNLSLSDAIFKLKFFKLKRSQRFAETVMLSSDMTRTYLPNQFPVQVDLRGINHAVSRENRHPECWRQEIPLKSLEFYHLKEQVNFVKQ